MNTVEKTFLFKINNWPIRVETYLSPQGTYGYDVYHILSEKPEGNSWVLVKRIPDTYATMQDVISEVEGIKDDRMKAFKNWGIPR